MKESSRMDCLTATGRVLKRGSWCMKANLYKEFSKKFSEYFSSYSSVYVILLVKNSIVTSEYKISPFAHLL